jgi:hypothetical protein
MDTPLTDSDLRALLGDISILTYPQLRDCQHIEQCMDSMGRACILFLTDSATSGHWIGLLATSPTTVEYVDSYGLSPDAEFGWLPARQERKLGQTRHELTRLIREAEGRGITVEYSSTKLQSVLPRIATCGRHVASRLLHGWMSSDEYVEMVTGSAVSADEFVTLVTAELLAVARRHQ